jgi:NAD(P)-dependent dehydrogenase (short-subunit alcohol dehydrogenase family)
LLPNRFRWLRARVLPSGGNPQHQESIMPVNTRYAVAVFAALAAFAPRLSAAEESHAGKAAHEIVPADQIKWGQVPPSLPKGAQLAVIQGDPSAAGELVTLRLKMPKGYTLPPHFHPTDEAVTVLADALAGRHEVVRAARGGAVKVDLEDAASVARLFETVKDVDAVVCCAGSAAFKPLDQLTDADFQASLRSKLMGQVNLARTALRHVRDGGSVTLTSGVLAREPMPGGAAISLVNAALEGFVLGAAIEAPRGVRVNVVSPPWISETLAALKMDPKGGIPAAACARAYVAAVEGKDRGKTLDARAYARG